ncbi:rhodanese-like domain-containing protein [Cohnella algarum]|uniref:rhodanese-like domain-containing protein n=1 Tax=Cohnella algarum TaxID=2044859 RepID=UPI0019671D69|nr:rhodanese-like domain-containing protein [Cohnella algarum]MBN2981790.1 rhodanese-like domain-containing protein [Cohnella algarum]
MIKKYGIWAVLVLVNVIILAAVIGRNEEKPTLQFVDTAGLMQMIESNENLMIIDVREPELFAAGRVPGSVNIPFEQAKQDFKKLPTDKKIVFVCHTGRMGTEVGNLLLENGYKQVYNLNGGMAQWTGELET